MTTAAGGGPGITGAAAFCWADGAAPGRNHFVSFERRFDRTGTGPVHLHLFADTRYRLFVNGVFIAYGPGRFVTAHPEHDSFELSTHLRPGGNLVRVEVNAYGASSFQTMPDGRPGFIADGGTADGAISFATPGAWKALTHAAWDAEAPAFSFAQNPAEICDTRLLAAELAAPAGLMVAALGPDERPWNRPVPRSVPYPDYATVRPARVQLSGPLADDLRWGVQLRRPRPGADGVIASRRSYATWIHAPRTQQVRLDCFWTDLQLNGAPVAIAYPNRLGNHGEAQVELRAGWNLLAGSLDVLIEQWPLLLGLPRSSGASLHALPDRTCRETFALSGARTDAFILPCPAAPDGFALPEGWAAVASDLARVTPARMVAWDAAGPEAVLDQALPGPAWTARGALWSHVFAEEYFGHPVIEVEAPAGAILDIAYDDWRRADGCVALYRSNPFTDAADRFILRGGRQRIEVLNPRGGIHLQVVLRVPDGHPPAPLRVHAVEIRRRTVLTMAAGSFACGDPVLDWSWGASLRTLQCSTDEAYADCPWRERSAYIGDSLVNLHLNRLITHDLAVARRTLDIFGQAQLPDGQLACSAPSWLRKPHEDFTLLWILAVRDYWAWTGDASFVESQWPVIRRILASPSWMADGDGLWDMTGCRVFLDWGAIPAEREGAGNAAVNILRVAALRALAGLASTLRRPAEAADLAAEAERVNLALMARLWDPAEGRFTASIGATTPALHANILALRFGIGPADRLLAYLEPLLRGNFAKARSHGEHSGHAELYFLAYALPALAAHGRTALAEALIEEHYGFLRSLGHATLPEVFHAADRGQGSCCHSWSGAPAIFAMAHVLGLQQAAPGDPDRFHLAPTTTRDRADGVLPHRAGPIRIAWERRDGRIHARVHLPPGVSLTAANEVSLRFA